MSGSDLIIAAHDPGVDISPGRDEFGYFLFEASDITVRCQQDVDPHVDTGDAFHHYGPPIIQMSDRELRVIRHSVTEI